MRFFDINPSGRILNRFSKDLGQARVLRFRSHGPAGKHKANFDSKSKVVTRGLFFTPKFCFFYTKIFSFFYTNFFTPTFLLFYTKILDFFTPKLLFTPNFCVTKNFFSFLLDPVDYQLRLIF